MSAVQGMTTRSAHSTAAGASLLRAGGVSMTARSQPAALALASSSARSFSVVKRTSGRGRSRPARRRPHWVVVCCVHVEGENVEAVFGGGRRDAPRQGGLADPALVHSNCDDLHVQAIRRSVVHLCTNARSDICRPAGVRQENRKKHGGHCGRCRPVRCRGRRRSISGLDVHPPSFMHPSPVRLTRLLAAYALRAVRPAGDRAVRLMLQERGDAKFADLLSRLRCRHAAGACLPLRLAAPDVPWRPQAGLGAGVGATFWTWVQALSLTMSVQTCTVAEIRSCNCAFS